MPKHFFSFLAFRFISARIIIEIFSLEVCIPNSKDYKSLYRMLANKKKLIRKNKKRQVN